MYVCLCHGVTDRQIRELVDEGASSLGDVQRQLPVGSCCGRCVDSAHRLIDEHRSRTAACCEACPA